MDRNLERNSLKNIKNGRGNGNYGRYKRRARILTAIVPILTAALIVSGYFLKKAYDDIDRYTEEIEKLKMDDIAGITPEAEATPIAKPTITPQVYLTETPKFEGTDTPEAGPGERPEIDETGKPKVSPTETPKFDETGKPEAGPSERPETDETGKSKVNTSETPENVETDIPEADPSETPENVVTDTPEADPSETPENVVTDTPEAAPTKIPEIKMSVTPAAEPVIPQESDNTQESQENDDFPLQKGSVGERVEELQRLLQIRGYLSPENEEEGTLGVDGVWGEETDQAVKDYFKDAGKQINEKISLTREEYDALIEELRSEIETETI